MNFQTVERMVRGQVWLRRAACDWKERFPTATAAVRRALWSAGRQAEIRRHFAEHSVIKIQIGTGPYALPGWLNTDLEPASPGVVFLDATEPLPFANESIHYMYSEHMIEHIGYAQGLGFLRECRRVLKPGGQLRIATPNLLNLVRCYCHRSDAESQTYLASPQYNDLPASKSRPCAVLNHFVRSWGHQFIYDPDTLRAALEAVGFEDVRFCAVGESEHPVFRNLESHGRQIGDWNNRFETMVVEAARAN